MKLLLLALAVPGLARHTLQHGPPSDTRFAVSGDSVIFQGDSALAGGSDLRSRGQTIADELIFSLIGDKSAYRLEHSALNELNGIYSAHYRQRFNGRDTQGMMNVNIDVAQASVISYGDSFFDTKRGCDAPSTRGSQIVFGKKWACLDASGKEDPVDPRLALISFLMPVKSADGVFAVAPDAHLDDLLDSIWIEHPFSPTASSAENRVVLHGAPGASQPVEAKLSYMAHEERLKLVWEFVYYSKDNAYNAFVTANRGEGLETIAITDWVRDFAALDDIPEWPAPVPPKSPKKQPKKEEPPTKKPLPPVDPASAEYLIYGWGCNDPTECDRKLIVNPADQVASPNGWHHIPTTDKQSKAREEDWAAREGWTAKLGGGLNSSDTRSNNVFAQENWSGGSSYEMNYRPEHHNLSFVDKLHWGKDHANSPNWTDHAVEPHSYIAASVTELFYTINELHDLTYRYGFDEEAGNFQQVNDKTGRGIGGDPVHAMAQDGSGTNNANFMTPPDGHPGRMRMYIWTTGDEKFFRDGDLEAGIVTHEMMHGVSTRLTGPPSNPSCLGWAEAGGMGEGWGDAFATIIRHHARKTIDYSMGSWAYGNVAGIRKYPYSLNMTVNPSTYGFLNRPGYWEVHSIGEVWAQMLYSCVEALIAKHGWTPSLFPPLPSDTAAVKAFYNTSSVTGRRYPAHGNTLAFQLVLDGMKLQPCRPKFVDARDAILQADKVLTGGENGCLIWKAFASRGLGTEAKVVGETPWGGGVHTEDFSLPAKCKKSHH